MGSKVASTLVQTTPERGKSGLKIIQNGDTLLRKTAGR